MLKILLGKLIKKHGLIGILIMVGDIAVKVTKTKKDDKAWAKIKKAIKSI
tara:strand:+ start:348 stop:497 length:150 start_codon:yes stop_codon:yes gene_type:complete